MAKHVPSSTERSKPSFNIKLRGEIDTTLKRLSEIVQIDGEQISWPSWELDEDKLDLTYKLKFEPHVEDYVAERAIWQSLNKCARENDFRQKFFMRLMREIIQEEQNISKIRYIGITQLNIRRHSRFPKSIPALDCNISLDINVRPRIEKIITNMDRYVSEKLAYHSEFIFAYTTISARSERYAIDLAERNVRFASGLINLFYHGYGISKRFGIPNTPLGKVLSAAPLVIFDVQKGLAPSYFADNHYPISFKSSFSADLDYDVSHRRKIGMYTARMNKTSYASKISQAITLFQEGLEASGVDLALLRFWTGIEVLCSREQKESTERVIERASSIFTNPSHAALRLKFIQEFRNRIVHHGVSSDNALLCAQWGSIILAAIIRFTLFNNLKITDHDDLIEYMFLPSKKSTMTRQIQLLKRKLKQLP